MRLSLLMTGFVVPVYLTACDVRKSESTKDEPSLKDVPADTVKTEKPTEEAPVETEDVRGEVPGAIIGAAAGEIIGLQSGSARDFAEVGAALEHQSGSALEGAAIGAAAGAIEYQPDEVEEE